VFHFSFDVAPFERLGTAKVEGRSWSPALAILADSMDKGFRQKSQSFRMPIAFVTLLDKSGVASAAG